MMGTLLSALLGSVPWVALLTYQAALYLIYVGHEFIWSRSMLGIHSVPEVAK